MASIQTVSINTTTVICLIKYLVPIELLSIIRQYFEISAEKELISRLQDLKGALLLYHLRDKSGDYTDQLTIRHISPKSTVFKRVTMEMTRIYRKNNYKLVKFYDCTYSSCNEIKKLINHQDRMNPSNISFKMMFNSITLLQGHTVDDLIQRIDEAYSECI